MLAAERAGPAARSAKMKIALFLVATLAFVSCADIPRDPERTEALVRETGVIRLGWIGGAAPDEAADEALSKLSSNTRATIERHEGASEVVLANLKNGKLDLVYGHFPQSSPWAKEVHFGHALGWRAKAPKHEHVPRFAMRNGENGWVMLVEEASRP
jgi:hypothetical protein